ncbi:transporter substrate-binding domain-containing protein [Vibrio sp. JC009]|uniref:substrate-binding periplasmic protein n=1 Tax=Vibrio sp. JC009 TaxID=2912314 RepID=UPI0023AED35B|nr:transporter substrate-binding domain-containing protein [Vibrio sp. JC009]WED20672.1 transporter substrate-binding domain-containing protein [Vibrio sp. JC009]
MRKALLTIINSLFILLSANCLAGGTVRLSAGEWKPYISESLDNYGYFTQIVTEAFAAAGIEAQYDFYPWKRAVYQARTGVLDGCIAIAKSEDREREFWFSEQPILVGERVFFYRKEQPFDWVSVYDLRGIPLGATLEYFYGDDFEKAEESGELDVDRVTTDSQNFKKLVAKRIQAFPITKEVGYYILNTEFDAESAKMITHHPKPLITTSFYVILSKANPENENLMKTFNKGFEALKKSGRYEELTGLLQRSVQGN